MICMSKRDIGAAVCFNTIGSLLGFPRVVSALTATSGVSASQSRLGHLKQHHITVTVVNHKTLANSS